MIHTGLASKSTFISHSFGEHLIPFTPLRFRYCKDVVILCSLLHVMSVVSPRFYWLLVLIPVCVLYKLWAFLSPWLWYSLDK